MDHYFDHTCCLCDCSMAVSGGRKGGKFMSTGYIVAGIAVMALVTYLVRVLPIVIFRKKITNVRVKSFLYYVPYACLAAMTFPAILSATSNVVSGAVGFVVALILAYKEKSLLTVALFACAAVFVVERLMIFF